MSKNKPPQAPKKNEEAIVRSSAAEYLSFVAASGSSESSVEMRYENENIWLTQKMMASLYDVSVPAINQHLKCIFADNELERGATVKQYLIVQTEGSREVQREVEHYNLQAIIAVGFKIENERAVQFRKWANQIVKNYTIQGWTMDVERLKQGGSILTVDFLSVNWKKSGKFGFPSASSTKKSLTSMLLHWITTRPPRRQSVCLPPCKTRCTSPYTVRQRRKCSSIVRITKMRIWG
jgi:hypothetical protein